MLSFKSCALRSVHVPLPVSLQWLILTDNRLAELPHQIGELVLMRKLMLSNNRALHTLMMCMLCNVYNCACTCACAARALRVHCVRAVYARHVRTVHAGLGALPRSMAAMRDLELLRLANNRLRRLPLWKAAARRLRPIRPAPRPARASSSLEGGLQPRPASANWQMFWLAGHTGRVLHIGDCPNGCTRCPA